MMISSTTYFESSGRALSNATPYVNLVNNSNQVSATLMNIDLLCLLPRSEMKTQAHAETQKYVERHVYCTHIRKDSSDKKLY